MTAQHTPGPWHTSANLMNEDERFVYSTELGGVIAGVWPWGDDEVGEQQREANARLIAAAPLMLEALRGARERVAGYEQSARDHNEPWFGLAQAVAIMDNAIAAATGEDA